MRKSIIIKKIISQLVDWNHKYFKKFNRSGDISHKDMNYFTYEDNLGELHLLTNIDKRILNISGRPVISNCGMPTEKVWVFGPSS